MEYAGRETLISLFSSLKRRGEAESAALLLTPSTNPGDLTSVHHKLIL